MRGVASGRTRILMGIFQIAQGSEPVMLGLGGVIMMDMLAVRRLLSELLPVIQEVSIQGLGMSVC